MEKLESEREQEITRQNREIERLKTDTSGKFVHTTVMPRSLANLSMANARTADILWS